MSRRGAGRCTAIVAVLLTAALVFWPAQARAQASCRFVLGFAELRELLGPEAVGDCLEDQQTTEGGDARQRTTRGVLIWRSADGATTWVLGPFGVQMRAADARFDWEPPATVADVPRPVAPAPQALPAPQPALDPDLAARCFRVSTELILQSAPDLPPDRSDVAERAHAAFQRVCREAAVKHGVKGVDCFEWAFRQGLEQSRLLPRGSDAGGRAAFALFDQCVSAR
jgi:hypothetical protein